MPPDVRTAYLTASRAAVSSIVADYRASASIDLDHDHDRDRADRADRADGTKLRMPVASIAQDWGDRLGFDPQQLWRAWAPDFRFHPITAGHFMAESHPPEITALIWDLIGA